MKRFKYRLAIFIFTIIPIIGFGQASVSKMNKEGVYIGINSTLLQNSIVHEVNNSLEYKSPNPSIKIGGSLETGYSFSSYFGINLGIGYLKYEQESFLYNYTDTAYNLMDSENDMYEMRKNAHSISDIQTIGMLDIPIALNISIPLGFKSFLYLKPGIALDIPIENSSEIEGNISYVGYYPKYNVEIHDIPYENFNSSNFKNVTTELKIPNIILMLNIKAGVEFFMGRMFLVSIGANYNQSITKFTDTNQTVLSGETELNSLSNLSGSSKLIGIGGYIGLSIFPF